MIENKIEKFLALCKVTGAVRFDQDKYVLPDNFENEVKLSAVPYDISGSEIHLKIIKHFEDCEVQYVETIDGKLSGFDNKKEIVLVSTTGCCWYEPSNNSISSKGSIHIDTQRKFKNAIAYFRFFDFLIQKGISDYFNDANREIVFYNSANGIIKIGFDPRPVIDFPGDISEDLKSLQELASYPQITSVFVNSIYLLTQGSGQTDLKSLVADRKKLFEITKRDYELLSKRFDFENFRNSLYLEKEKYFDSIRDLVSKIFGQAVGIPVSIGASVFTSYKVEGNWFVIILLLAGFLVYLIYYIRLQFIYRSDINEVQSQFTKDFEVISSDSGLPHATIVEERNKVEGKITKTKIMQNWLIAMVLVLGLLATGFMISQLFQKKSHPDTTIKDFTEAIKKYNLMADSIHQDLSGAKDAKYSPEHFNIEVTYNNHTYEVNVMRVSAAGHPNEYYATIPTPDSIMNKYPPVRYVVDKEDLKYTDNLTSIFPGFAALQKTLLLEEIKRNGWKL